MTQKAPKCEGKKAPAGGGEFALTLRYRRGKNLKNDTKSPCIFTRKCHKAGVWVIENFLTRSFIFAILWRFCLS